MLALSFELPAYTAVMLLCPGGNFEVVYLAVPDVSGTVARRVVPFRYLILPVGVPPPDCGDTVAVKVTDLPFTEGFKDDTSVVVVIALTTTWDKGADVLEAKLESPP